MAITILSQPDSYQPDYSIDGHQLSYVLDSTQSYLCSMKYIGDVYINGDYVTTIKNSPNLKDGKCVMTFNEVISDFISYDRWNGPNFQICTQSKCDYKIIFGEETDGTSDCSNGTFGIQYGPSHSGIAFNGTLQYAEKTFDANQYLMNTGSTASFLTNSPRTRQVNINDHDFLYFITDVAVPATASGFISTMHVQVRCKNKTGTPFTNYYIVNRNPCNIGDIICLAVGPEDLNNYVSQGIVYTELLNVVNTPIITCNVESYDITLGYRNNSVDT